MNVSVLRIATSLGLFALLLVAGVLLWSPDASPAASPTAYETSPADTSTWRLRLEAAGYDVQSLVATPSLLDVTSPAAAALIIMHPTAGPTSEGAAAMDQFLADGGSMLVADPDGAFNAWLRPWGASVAAPSIIQPGLPAPYAHIAPKGSNWHATTSSVHSLVLEDETGWTAWLWSKPTSHLDLDGNGTIDRADLPGPFVVAASRSLPAGGHLIVMGEARAFVNLHMNESADRNRELAQAAAQILLPEGGTIIFDETRTGLSANEAAIVSPTRAAESLRRLSPAIQAMGIGVLAIICLGINLLASPASALGFHQQEIRARDPVRLPSEAEPADAARTDGRQNTRTPSESSEQDEERNP